MFNELNILRPFFENPGSEYGVREVGRIIDVAPATASKELKNFSINGVLVERKERMYNLYKANVTNDLYIDLKTFFYKRRLKDSGLLNEINKAYDFPIIILKESNDSIDSINSIELIIFTNINKKLDISRSEKKLGKKIRLNIIKKNKLNQSAKLNEISDDLIVIQGETNIFKSK